MAPNMIFEVAGECRASAQLGPIGSIAMIQLSRPSNFFNDAMILPDDPLPTDSRAEIAAIVFALETTLNDTKQLAEDQLVDITIKTSSLYAIVCMTLNASMWRNNGWLDDNGNPIAEADLLQTALDVEKALKKGVKVRYEYLPREENAQAFGLCTAALDMQEGAAQEEGC